MASFDGAMLDSDTLYLLSMTLSLSGPSSQYPEFMDCNKEDAISYLEHCKVGDGIAFIGQSLEARKIAQHFDNHSAGERPLLRLQTDFCDGFGESHILVLERFDAEVVHEEILKATPSRGLLGSLRAAFERVLSGLKKN